MLTLFSPDTGAPLAIMDATLLTWMRTGAVTAIGAKYLAGEKPRRIGSHRCPRHRVVQPPHAGPALRFPGDPGVTRKRAGHRGAVRRRNDRRLGKTVVALATPEETARDAANIIIDASRLMHPEVLVQDKWVKPGALIQPYGVVPSVERTLPFSVDKMVVDDWDQCQRSPLGQFAEMCQTGELRTEHIYGEIGEIVAGLKPGRERSPSASSFGTRASPSATSRSGT